MAACLNARGLACLQDESLPVAISPRRNRVLAHMLGQDLHKGRNLRGQREPHKKPQRWAPSLSTVSSGAVTPG